MRISSVDSCGIMHIIQSVYSKQCTFPLNLCIKSHRNRLFDTYMYKCVYTFSAILLLKRFCFVFWLYSFMLLSFLVSLYFVFCIGFWLECLLGNSIIFNFDAVRMTLCVCVHLFAFSAFNSGCDCSFFHTFCHDQVWFVCSMTFGLSGASIFDFSLYCSFNILFTLFDSLKKIIENGIIRCGGKWLLKGGVLADAIEWESALTHSLARHTTKKNSIIVTIDSMMQDENRSWFAPNLWFN